MRTTTAPTMLAAGEKENVIPPLARAWVNFRILPGDTVAEVKRHAERAIGDPRVIVTASDRSREPSPVSPVDSAAFAQLAGAIRAVFPDAVVTPALTLAGTDSRHYGVVSENVLRFMPFRLEQSDLSRIHGLDERLSIESYGQALRFYRYFLRLLASGEEAKAR
jgi:carboxypeptidase PM20D1